MLAVVVSRAIDFWSVAATHSEENTVGLQCFRSENIAEPQTNLV